MNGTSVIQAIIQDSINRVVTSSSLRENTYQKVSTIGRNILQKHLSTQSDNFSPEDLTTLKTHFEANLLTSCIIDEDAPIETINTAFHLHKLFFPNEDSICSPLFWAIQKPSAKTLIKALLNKGYDVNAKNSKNETPLHIAIQNKDYETMEMLINEENIDLSFVDENQETYLHLLIHYGERDRDQYYTIMELLLEKQPDLVNKQNKDFITALFMSVENNDREAVDLLLDYDADPNIANNKGDMPLHKAALLEVYFIADLLLENDANIEACNERGQTPLFNVILNTEIDDDDLPGDDEEEQPSRINFLDIFLQHQVNLHHTDIHGKSPLHYALQQGLKDISIYLLQNNPDFSKIKIADEQLAHVLPLFPTKELLHAYLAKAPESQHVEIIYHLIARERLLKIQRALFQKNVPMYRMAPNFCFPSFKLLPAVSLISLDTLQERFEKLVLFPTNALQRIRRYFDNIRTRARIIGFEHLSPSQLQEKYNKMQALTQLFVMFLEKQDSQTKTPYLQDFLRLCGMCGHRRIQDQINLLIPCYCSETTTTPDILRDALYTNFQDFLEIIYKYEKKQIINKYLPLYNNDENNVHLQTYLFMIQQSIGLPVSTIEPDTTSLHTKEEFLETIQKILNIFQRPNHLLYTLQMLLPLRNDLADLIKDWILQNPPSYFLQQNKTELLTNPSIIKHIQGIYFNRTTEEEKDMHKEEDIQMIQDMSLQEIYNTLLHDTEGKFIYRKTDLGRLLHAYGIFEDITLPSARDEAIEREKRPRKRLITH